MPQIGLDLGRSFFRAVEIKKEKDFHILQNYGTYTGMDLDLNFASEESLNAYAAELKHFFKEHNFSTSEVVVAIPEQYVFIRTINAPIMSHKELKNFIVLGAEEYIPIPIDQVTFDAQIIESTPKKDKNAKNDEKTAPGLQEDEMSVLLVASKNDTLSRYVDLIKRADLVPVGMEPETLSIERVLGDTIQRPSASIIVNISTMSTQIIVTYKGFVRFTRSLSIGGDALTKAIEKNLDLDYHQAEEYKKAYGLDESQVEGKVFNAIRPIFDNILLEIKRSKTYYTTHNPDVTINRVIMSGGTALMPGLLLYIANKLDVEAELANPWRNIKLSETLKNHRNELMDAGPVYATSVGLALKEV